MKPYYQDSKAGITIYHADCRDVLPVLPDTSIDITITSPPYNIGKQYGAYTDKQDDYLPTLADVFAQIRRVTSCFWLNVGYRQLPEGNIPIAFQVWDKVGMYLVQAITWEYGAGMTYKTRFNHRSEHWLWYAQDENYLFRPDWVRDPSLAIYSKDKRNNPLGKLPGDVWYYPHVSGTFDERVEHPAQYPIKMIERIILACSYDAAIVLDPFMGSGSTLVAAKLLGRKAIGIEINERYCEIATLRLMQEVMTFEEVVNA